MQDTHPSWAYPCLIWLLWACTRRMVEVWGEPEGAVSDVALVQWEDASVVTVRANVNCEGALLYLHTSPLACQCLHIANTCSTAWSVASKQSYLQKKTSPLWVHAQALCM